jgi:hypothetical protein
MTNTLPLPLSRTVRTRALHPDDIARLLERGRILLSASCEALIEAEHVVPEASKLADELDRLLPRLRALVDRYNETELPLAG